MSLTVAPSEHGIVRVFSLSMSAAEADALKADKNPGVLGLSNIDPTYIEVFPVSDLEQLGVAGYLATGCAITAEQIDPDRAKLDQLDGWVLIVFSAAFGGEAATLAPVPELTLIGTYQEPGVDWSANQTLTTASASGTTSPAKKKPSDAAMSGRIAMLVLIIVFALTGLMVWIAA